MQIGELINIKEAKINIPFNLKAGNILVVNVYIIEKVFHISIAGSKKSAEYENKKRRPLVMYEKVGNHFKFYPLSTYDRNRFKEIKFNFSNCKKLAGCKDFFFKKEASVFIRTRFVKRNNNKIRIKTEKFSLDLLLLEKFINNNKFFNKKKVELSFEENNPLSFFKICHECNVDYVKNIARKIYER